MDTQNTQNFFEKKQGNIRLFETMKRDFYVKAGFQYAAIPPQPTFFCACDSRPGQSSRFYQFLRISKVSLERYRVQFCISHTRIQFQYVSYCLYKTHHNLSPFPHQPYFTMLSCLILIQPFLQFPVMSNCNISHAPGSPRNSYIPTNYCSEKIGIKEKPEQGTFLAPFRLQFSWNY